ncbi:AI-2E family transporter [Clostridium sediminicola]|uniref:AI-2E family transporter n=1 Tax=Clostridium sediminicola TaxID=3114879 RepID=UPI0031F1E7A9
MKKIRIISNVNKKNLIYLTIILVILVSVFKFEFLREIFCIILYSFSLYYVIKPLQKKLLNKGFNRKLSSFILILCLFISIFFILIYFIPLAFRESLSLTRAIDEIEEYFAQLPINLKVLNNNKILLSLLNNIYKRGYNALIIIVNNILDNAIEMGDNLLALLVIPVITYYLLCDSKYINNKILYVFPIKLRKIIRKICYDIDKILSRYILSQFILCGIVTFFTFILLIVFDIKYPILLSFINGIFNIIPYFGPIFGAIPVILVTFIYSPQIALYVTIAMYLIQFIEGNIIAPKITGDSVDLHPIVVILVLVISGKIAGFIGMIMAIPLTVIIKVIYEDLNYYLY